MLISYNFSLHCDLSRKWFLLTHLNAHMNLWNISFDPYFCRSPSQGFIGNFMLFYRSMNKCMDQHVNVRHDIFLHGGFWVLIQYKITFFFLINQRFTSVNVKGGDAFVWILFCDFIETDCGCHFRMLVTSVTFTRQNIRNDMKIFSTVGDDFYVLDTPCYKLFIKCWGQNRLWLWAAL